MTTLGLLVGTNPLPNVVTALWLHANGSLERVRLYYTQPRKGVLGDVGTEIVAQRIQKLCENRLGAGVATLVSLPGPVDARAIEQTIVDDLHRAGGSDLHVSYTGGTKPMARGAWRAAERLARDSLQVTTSYLDDRTGRHYLRLASLTTGGTVEAGRWQLTDDLRRDVSLGFDDVLRIHGFRSTGRTPQRQADGIEMRDKLVRGFQQAGETVGRAIGASTILTATPCGAMVQALTGGPTYDLDVVAVAGYQLFVGRVVPPAHADNYRARVKRTAFETLMLASRLGGEEVRVCVASELSEDDAKVLADSLILDDRDETRRVTVLGRVTLEDQVKLARTLESLMQ